jgi:tRNA(Arg) A34 adenosine deaminase TadA
LKKKDKFYFEWALSLAKTAANMDFSPVGAVLVNKDGLVWPASSKRLIGNIQHAELRAMISCQSDGEIHTGLTLYSTLEPCVMCGGMAAVMHVDCIKWLVDDVWAGVSSVCNPAHAYVEKNFPRMEKVDLPELYEEAKDMWEEYLKYIGAHLEAR